MKTTIDAPNLGQRLTFANHDDVLRALTLLQPGAWVPMHIHLHQYERFTMRAGALEVWVNGEHRTFGPGDAATAAPGVPHRFANRSGAPVEVDVELWPAMRTRELFETLFALDRAGKLNRMGAPSPLRLGLLTREFGDEIFLLSRPSPSVQLALGRMLGVVASRIGSSLVPA